MTCECPVPRESPNPRYDDCTICGKPIDRRWTSNDQTVGAFFDRLAETFPGGRPPDVFQAFRALCIRRERVGREHFGHSFLARDNGAEAQEEAADLANYMLFSSLRQVRESGGDEDIALELTGAWFAFKAYECAAQLSAKRRGAP